MEELTDSLWSGKRLNLVAIFVSLVTPWVLFCGCLAWSESTSDRALDSHIHSHDRLMVSRPVSPWFFWFVWPRHFCCFVPGPNFSIWSGHGLCLEKMYIYIWYMIYDDLNQQFNNCCSLADWQVWNLPATSRLYTSTQVLPATLLEPIHSLVICHHWVGCNVPCRVFCSQDAAWPSGLGCFRLWVVGCLFWDVTIQVLGILTLVTLITWFWTSVVCDFAGPSRRWRIGPCSFLVLPTLTDSNLQWPPCQPFVLQFQSL